MLPGRLLPHEVIWQQPTAIIDEYGDMVLNFLCPITTPIRAWMQQQGEKHNTDGVDSKAHLWIGWTNCLEIHFGDRLYWPRRNLTFQVDQEPHVVETPAGVHHAEVSCQRIRVAV